MHCCLPEFLKVLFFYVLKNKSSKDKARALGLFFQVNYSLLWRVFLEYEHWQAVLSSGCSSSSDSSSAKPLTPPPLIILACQWYNCAITNTSPLLDSFQITNNSPCEIQNVNEAPRLIFRPSFRWTELAFPSFVYEHDWWRLSGTREAFSVNGEADVMVLSIWGFHFQSQVVNEHWGDFFRWRTQEQTATNSTFI